MMNGNEYGTKNLLGIEMGHREPFVERSKLLSPAVCSNGRRHDTQNMCLRSVLSGLVGMLT